MSDDKVESFEALHRVAGGFIMPNAWDAGSAVILAAAGFPAIATTSAGIAFSLGRPDYDVRNGHLAVSREIMFERIGEIARAVAVPVNADLEAGYGDSPEAVAATVGAAIEIGLAGGNIEDKKPHEEGLYDETLAAERIRAAREAIDASGAGFVLTARTDVLLATPDRDLEACVRRANLYRAAGADCLYPPGATDAATIGRWSPGSTVRSTW
jgi:2-methylisocitrate lyase-like PEP mutase family enzyme